MRSEYQAAEDAEEREEQLQKIRRVLRMLRTPKRSIKIKISYELYQNLDDIAGPYDTMDDVITFLLKYYRRNRDPEESNLFEEASH